MRNRIFTKWSALIFVLFVTVGANAQQNNSEFTYTVSGNEATITGFSTPILKVGAKKVEGRLVSSGDQINIVIPATINGKKVTSIAANAFRKAEADNGNVFNNVASVKFEGNNLKTIGDHAFQGCYLGNEDLEIPASVTSIGKGAFASTGVKNVIFKGTAADAKLNLKEAAFYNNPQLTTVTLPDNLCVIGPWCFALSPIKHINSPRRGDEITGDTVSDYAFAHTNISSIEIPSSVSKFGEGVFWCCFQLSSITNSSSILSVGEGDDEGVLFDSNKDTLYFFPSKPVMTRTYQYLVPTSVKRIAAGAFALSADVNQNVVTTVILPSYLNSIGDLAFNAYPWAKSPITHLTIPSKYSVSTTTSGSTIIDSTGVQSMGKGCLPNGNLQELVFTGVVGREDTDGNSDYRYRKMLETAFTPLDTTINDEHHVYGGGVTGVKLYTMKDVYDSFIMEQNGIETSFTLASGDSTVENTIESLEWQFKVTIPENREFITLSRDFAIGDPYHYNHSVDTTYADTYVVFNQAENDNTTINSRKSVIARQAYFCPGRTGNDKDQYLGLIVKGTPNTTYVYTLGDEIANNSTFQYLVQGTFLEAAPCMTYVYPTDTIGTSTYYNYGLYNNEFHRYSKGGYISPRKAYLQLPVDVVASSKGISVEFIDDPVDGIKDVKTPTTENSAWYNLQGLRLNEKPTTAGIYIHNGRKVVIK